MSDYGERVRRARKEAGLRQHQLAERVGVNQATLSRLERGTYAPNADLVHRVGEVLGVAYVGDDAPNGGVADRIRRALNESGKSAAAASQEAGLSRSAIQDILSGNSASLRLDTLEKLAGPLGCSLNYLASGSDGPTTPRRRSRTEQAVEAAAEAFHETSRNKRQFHWETSSPEWRADIRAFVRPMVEAALLASDAYLAAAVTPPKTEEN